MKNFVIFTLFLFLVCCKTKETSKNETLDANEIVDYNKSYDFYNRSLDFKSFEKHIKNKTIYLIDNKVVKYEVFKNALNENKLKSFKIVEDSSSIVNLNFSYNNVKRIIITTKK